MFANYSIKTRLTAGFGVILGLLLILTTVSVVRMQGIRADLDTMNSVNSVKQRYAINFRGSVHDRAISLRDVVLASGPAEMRPPFAEIVTLSENYAKSSGPLDAMLTPDKLPTPQEVAILDSIKDAEKQTLPVIERVSDLARSGQRDEAQRLLLTEAKPLFVTWLARINQYIDLKEDTNRGIKERVADSTSAFLLKSLLLTLLALVAGGGIAWSVIRALAPIKGVAEEMNSLAGVENGQPASNQNELGKMSEAVAAMRKAAAERARLEDEKKKADAEQEYIVQTLGSHLERLAAGDLTADIQAEFPPSYQQLKATFNIALDSLSELIASVADSAAQIRTGSSEIAQASEDLARRTESNAASLEQTSAAIVQMDDRLKASASAANSTVGRADQAISTVTGGRALADEAVQAMGRVSESAKGIDSVIEGLDKIAFQTRVLAMNAAVEAGRAGEAGRGFAVVADLVSALAMRAEEEAKRARDQLTVTQTDIGSAVGAVEKVDAALQNISADVGEVHALLGSMASDNQAQALAITEINSAISSMDQSTQQNAAMVEQTSAAARNLLSEVNGLAEQSGRFRHSATPGSNPASAKAAKPAAAARANRGPAAPARAKEGLYQSPIKPLPAAAIGALTAPRGGNEDWKDF